MFLSKEKLHIIFYSFTWHLIKIITILLKLSFIRFSYKHCNFSLGCLTRQDGFQNHDKVYFATNCLCLLLRCFLFIDCFILHGLIVGDRDKMSKNKSHGSCQKTIPEYSSTLIRREALGTSSASATKKMAENFTLFAMVGIIFYPPKPHRSRGTEIEF